MNIHLNNIRNLRTAPIQEALIDIQFNIDDRLSIEQLEKFANKIEGYPKRTPHLEYKIGFNFNSQDDTIEKNQLLNGYNLSNLENGRVFQLRLNGVTFNIIKAYKNWEEFTSDPKKHWSAFIKEFPYLSINRVAIRYINNFKIDFENLNDYFTLLPAIPDGLPKQMEDFNMQIILPNENKEIKAIIREYVKFSENGEKSIYLDIDAFKNKNEGFKNDEVWGVFDSLRKFKNEIFFNSTTYLLTSKYE